MKRRSKILICAAAAAALAGAAAAAMVFLSGGPAAHAGPSPAPGAALTDAVPPAATDTPEPAAPPPSAEPAPEESAPPTEPPEESAIVTGSGGSFTPGDMVPDSWFDDALFIGDSRTDGLRIYARAGKADYFVSTGLSVYTALTKEASDEDFSDRTLPALLDGRTYGKVLICLGINECGTDLGSLIRAYRELVDTVRQKEPGAAIILQGVMVCGRAKAGSDACFGPENINRLNRAIREMAAEAGAYYIDPNTVFADGEGYLPDELSGDGCHLHADCYGVWMDWIRCQAVRIPVRPDALTARTRTAS